MRSPWRRREALAGLFLLALAATGAGSAHATRAERAPASLSGQLLVATPELRDPRFVRTVIYMVRHDATGAMGLVVNRTLREVPLAQLLERLGLPHEGVSGSIRVHYGGPVEATRGFVLHTAEYSGAGTLTINDAMALTARPEILRDMATGAGPRRAFFALGYAGWAPGQLEAEIDRGAWISVPADEALVFGENDDEKWHRAMARRILDL